MNLRQIDAEDRVQCRPRIESRRIGRLVSMTSWRQPPDRFGCGVSKTLQDRFDPQIALDDLGVVGVVKLKGLSESKDMLLTPVSSRHTLVQMPRHVRLQATLSQVGRDHRSEMIHPTPNCLVGHRHSAFRQQILDVAQAGVNRR